MIRRTLLVVYLLFPILLQAQLQQLNAAEILADIQKLKVRGSVLYFAAHPDDENTRLLAYLSKEMQVRTGYLSLTRGDGGQNLIGNEQAEQLGLIRTQELLAARRIDGAEQFFTRANDFGFSKTAEESLKIWGKEQILADAVWVIRKFRPDVIICRFPEDARAGHGQHAASAIIAREAFIAAADRSRFPEQFKYVGIWAAKRIVWNTYNFGGNNTTSPDQLKLNVGLYNPLLGKSYGEIAAISRTNHKSQGFGSTLQRGEAFEYFSPIAGEPAKLSLFDGIDITITDQQVLALINEIQIAFKPNQPWLSVQKLIQLKALLPDKKNAIDNLILACSGLYIEAIASEKNYAIGDSIPIKIQAIQRSPNTTGTASIVMRNQKQILTLGENKPTSVDLKIAVVEISQPYWLKINHSIGSYQISKQEDIGFPENPNPLSIELALIIDKNTINLTLPIYYRYTDPAKGEKYQSVIIAPAVTATLSEKAYVFTGNQSQKIAVQLKSFRNQNAGKLRLQLPEGWKSAPEAITYKFEKKDDEQTVYFTIAPGAETKNGNMALQVVGDGYVSDRSLKVITYDHIPSITYFPQASARLEKIDLKIAGKKIGYVDGAGDLTAEALKQIGYDVTHLSTTQILNGDLTGFDAIVIGVRLYNISDDIKLIHSKLMNYVKNGGTLVTQYNVNTNLKTQELGPYPFKLSNKRVTEEDAKVTFLAPNHQVLNYPNKITSKDFEGWIQERGIYFGVDLDSKYTPILEMNDQGETGGNGSLFVADYGKGKFVYTGLVFFRELPAGVPGAYRLFANLLAAKKP